MYRRGAITILRWGLAFTFFYAAVSGLLHPMDWIGFLPPFLESFITLKMALTVFSVYELALAALLFTGRKLQIASLLSMATLAAIVIFNMGTLDLVFRDVGLAMASLALFELIKKSSDKEISKDSEIL